MFKTGMTTGDFWRVVNLLIILIFNIHYKSVINAETGRFMDVSTKVEIIY